MIWHTKQLRCNFVGTDVQRVCMELLPCLVQASRVEVVGQRRTTTAARPPCNWLPIKPIELELTYTYQWEIMVVLCYLLLRLRESYHQVVLVCTFFHWDVSFVTKWWWVEFLFYLVLRNCCCTFTFQNQICSHVWRVGWMRSESSLCTSVKLQLFPGAGVGVCLNWVLSSVLIVQPWQQDLQPCKFISQCFLTPSMVWIAGNIKATS